MKHLTSTAALIVAIATADAANKPVLACNLNALTPAERTAHARLSHQLAGAIRSRTPVRNGFNFALGREISLPGLAAWIEGESKCCSFLTFELVLRPTRAGYDSIQLKLTGPAGTRAFLEEELRTLSQ